MRICPRCKRTYAAEAYACRLDGCVLIPASPDTVWVPMATSGLTYLQEPISPAESDTAVDGESSTLRGVDPHARTFPPTEGDAEHGYGFPDIDMQLVAGRDSVKLNQRYRPIARIAKGGMGCIYLVEERDSGRFVALKLMTGDAPPLVQQFIREGIITARLEHPNIIPVYDLGFLSTGQLYYTMRYIESLPLSELMPRFDLRSRVRILRDAARAVVFAHDQGLWHRDLKPDNILVGRFGDVYVIDWGLVTVQHGVEYKFDVPRIVVEKISYKLEVDTFFDRTRGATTDVAGLFAGTPPYMAPEQLVADDSLMGAASDVWAFGVMLFSAMSGQHPIIGLSRMSSLSDLLLGVQAGRIRDVRELVPDAPAALASLCQRMLARDSHRRIPLDVFIAEASAFLEGPVPTNASPRRGSGPTKLGW